MNVPMVTANGLLIITNDRVVRTTTDAGACCTCAPASPCLSGGTCSYCILNTYPRKIKLTLADVAVCTGCRAYQTAETAPNYVPVDVPSFDPNRSFVLGQTTSSCVWEARVALGGTATLYRDKATQTCSGTVDSSISFYIVRLTQLATSSRVEIQTVVPHFVGTSTEVASGRNCLNSGKVYNNTGGGCDALINPGAFGTPTFGSGGTATIATAACSAAVDGATILSVGPWYLGDCCNYDFTLTGMPSGWPTTIAFSRTATNTTWTASGAIPNAWTATLVYAADGAGGYRWELSVTRTGVGTIKLKATVDAACPPDWDGVNGSNPWSVLQNTFGGSPAVATALKVSCPDGTETETGI